MSCAHDLAHQIMAVWQRTKAERCATAGGPHDLLPMVEVRTAGDVHISTLGSLADTPIAVGTIAASVGPEHIDHFALLGDIYGVRADGRDAGAAERLAAGDLAGIYEALTVAVVEVATGDIATTMCRYRYDDGGQPDWEPTVEAALDGLTAELLRGTAAGLRDAREMSRKPFRRDR